MGNKPFTIDQVLAQEFSSMFVERMKNRVYVSFNKYGTAAGNFGKGNRLDALKCARLRLEEYQRTKNTEFLVDAANYLMFEYLFPSLEGAHFRATDSDESPGNVTKDGKVIKGAKL